jgi:hypothetical protein
MDLRHHARNTVDYAIRIALISLVAVPVWFCAWWLTGFHPGPERHPTGDLICGIVAIPGFVFLSPAYASVKFLAFLHVPADPLFGLLYFISAIVSVPLFWGAVTYSLVQLYCYFRRPRQRLTNR